VTHRKSDVTVEICILAGGLSSRMGRDKSRIRLGRRTILGHVRAIAAQLRLPVRVLRRDAVPRCGPLGGIYTALARSRADALLFLACDMPFISTAFLKQMLKMYHRRTNIRKVQRRTSSLPLLGDHVARSAKQFRGNKLVAGLGSHWAGVRANSNLTFAVFASHKKLVGLPCLLPRETALPIVSRQIANSQLSLQSLARALKAKSLTPLRQPELQLLNLNTPADLRAADQLTTACPPKLQRRRDR
jgi:molybdopterin-guanine dinucleotide biosynthesis protein A